ncbi:MAG: type II toxin-antitoxin system VapC family toxin [Anaerolineae bacterium]
MGSLESLPDRLRSAGAVALDTAIFIYAFEDHPQYGAMASEVFALIVGGDLRACCSVLALGEVLTGAYKAGRPDMALRYRALFQNMPGLEMCAMTAETANCMARLRAECGLRTPDAIHIGAAFEWEARAFLTNDGALRRVPGIEVLLLSDYV